MERCGTFGIIYFRRRFPEFLLLVVPPRVWVGCVTVEISLVLIVCFVWFGCTLTGAGMCLCIGRQLTLVSGDGIRVS